jgi:hypothetical protein
MRQELDRGQWATLDKIDYDIVVEGRGEAEAGPFWFGRAFDTPPFFTFSAVARGANTGIATQITVGVAEWLQDEQDMYVGAMLWFIFDACWEPFPTGMIISEDFENHNKAYLGGPDGNELIGLGRLGNSTPENPFTVILAWPSRPLNTIERIAVFEPGTSIFKLIRRGDLSPYKVMQDPTPSRLEDFEVKRSYWSLSDVAPAGGLWHLRQVQQPVSGPAVFSLGAIDVGTVSPCGYDLEGDAWFTLPLIRVAPGMTVKMRANAKVNDTYDQISYQFRFGVDFLDEKGVLIGSSGLGMSTRNGQTVGLTSLFTSYSKYEAIWHLIPYGGFDEATEVNWPANNNDIRYVQLRAGVGWNPVSNLYPYPELIFDVDDIEVELLGPAQSVSAPVFDVALNFGGQMLQGYSSVHPLRSYEAPLKVLLS